MGTTPMGTGQSGNPTPPKKPDEESKQECAKNDIVCELGVNPDEVNELLDFCAHDPNAPSCASLLPPETCTPIQIYQLPGTPYNPPGCRYAGTKTYIDWNLVDKWDLVVDIAGILGTIALGAAVFGMVPGYIGYGLSELAQIAGFVHDVTEMNAGAVTWDIVSTVAQDNKIVGRLIPAFGLYINIGSILDNLKQATVTVAVYEPYPRPSPLRYP